MTIRAFLDHLVNYRIFGKYRFRKAVLKTGFWFVDIPRTGSSAIRHNLASSYGFPHAKSNSYKLMYLPAHTPARKVQKIISPKDWKQLYSFAFVRNPYDRFASLYHHFRYREKTWSGSFSELARELPKYQLETRIRKKPMFATKQVDYLLDEKKFMLVSFIGKYEKRNEDLKTIKDRLKINTWSDKIQAASLLKPATGFQDMYNDELKELIYEYFFEDFKAFDYDKTISHHTL